MTALHKRPARSKVELILPLKIAWPALGILRTFHPAPCDHHGSVPAAHLAGLFFAAYNPLPWAIRRFSGSLAWRENGSSRHCLEGGQVRPDVSAGPMVAFALGGSSGLKRISYLLHLGSVAG